MEDMILMHDECRGCWSLHGSKWTPDLNVPLGYTMTKKTIDFMYMMNIYSAKLEGHFWMLNACFDSDHRAACATNLIVYAIQTAKPWFNSLGDGYFGLAPSTQLGGSDNLTDGKNNILEQMYMHKMITKKQFGVHTHMYNSTDDPSSIRFGGYNEELFKAGHKQRWINTTSNTQWHIELDSVQFHSENLLSSKIPALIDPGYPFIAMPDSEFDAFKQDVMNAYPDEPVTCTNKAWCYFFTPCEDLRDDMPDLKFSFKTNDDDGDDLTTYSIKPISFLYSDVDYRTNITTCHLGVIGQRWNDIEHWVLGGAFMENFYVTYDATNHEQLRIGLSYNQAESGLFGTSHGLVLLITMMVVVLLLCAFAILAVCFCCRTRQQARLARAKTYFDQLKQKNE